jgi:hypothetical protein
MGFLGSVGRALGGVIRQVAPQVLKAVAPAATSLLKKVTGDIFTKGKDFISAGLKALNLPSPIQNLAQRLLGSGLDKLNQLAQGGLEKLLQRLTGQPAPRTTADGVSVTTPPLETRADSIAANTPSAGGVGSSGSAATAGSGPAPAGGTPFGSPTGTSSPTLSGRTSIPNPSDFGDLTDANNQAKFQKAMQEYQTNMNMMQMYWQTVSNVMKSMSDALNAIARNVR